MRKYTVHVEAMDGQRMLDEAMALSDERVGLQSMVEGLQSMIGAAATAPVDPEAGEIGDGPMTDWAPMVGEQVRYCGVASARIVVAVSGEWVWTRPLASSQGGSVHHLKYLTPVLPTLLEAAEAVIEDHDDDGLASWDRRGQRKGETRWSAFVAAVARARADESGAVPWALPFAVASLALAAWGGVVASSGQLAPIVLGAICIIVGIIGFGEAAQAWEDDRSLRMDRGEKGSTWRTANLSVGGATRPLPAGPDPCAPVWPAVRFKCANPLCCLDWDHSGQCVGPGAPDPIVLDEMADDRIIADGSVDLVVSSPPFLALRRQCRRRNWWAYCAEHMYGRWIDDRRVWHWRLVTRSAEDES